MMAILMAIVMATGIPVIIQGRRVMAGRLKGQSGLATISIVLLVVLGVIVIGAVGTGAFLLSNSLTVTVQNKTGVTFDVAKGAAAVNLNFLPGIRIPSEIRPGETAAIKVPRSLIQSVTILPNGVKISAMGRDFSLGTGSIDMQRSTLDGQPLSSWVGKKIDTTRDHTLVLQGR
jgi:hypothetical protein